MISINILNVIINKILYNTIITDESDGAAGFAVLGAEPHDLTAGFAGADVNLAPIP